MARPLTDLTKESVSWQWTHKEENAFCTLKRSPVLAPVLHMPNFDLSFVVTTDASLVSVGAILEQDFGQGLQPVAYESRKLNPAETRYSAYERELLGIVWAIGVVHCVRFSLTSTACSCLTAFGTEWNSIMLYFTLCSI